MLIGIVGAPASGKTTLAHALVAALVEHEAPWAPAFRDELAADPSRPWIGSHVAHVPMDGYHLADIELRRLGRDQRKERQTPLTPAATLPSSDDCESARKMSGHRRSTATSNNRCPEASPCRDRAEW